MYNNPYLNNININDRIDNEIEKLKQMKANIQQPTPITQNFQLAPTSGMKFANTYDEVNKEMVYVDTPFFSKDMSVLWLKSSKGEIKTYELNEIIPKDEKDLKIELLQSQIEELKGMIKNEKYITDVTTEQDETNTKGDVTTNGTTVENGKSSSIQKVSRSKKE